MRRRLAVFTVLLVAALSACHPAAAFLPHDSVHSSSASTTPAPPPPPKDPCWDFHELERGIGTPDRQAWHNSLRTDGRDDLGPDYLRYWVACQVEGDGGPTWNPRYSRPASTADRRWSTSEYNCVRGLLDGEHGNLPWNTDHRNGEGVNIPQAKPVSKLAGLDERGQLRWMVDYINGTYGGPFRTPNPCDAGY